MYNVSQWGTADAEIKFPSVENQELTNVLLLKPGKGAIFWTNIVASSFRVRFKCCFLGWGRGVVVKLCSTYVGLSGCSIPILSVQLINRWRFT